MKRVFKQIAEENIEDLILDVRNNGGGFPETVDELLTYLIHDDVQPSKMEYAIVQQIHNEEYFKKDGFSKHFSRQKLEKKGNKFNVKGATSKVIKPHKYAFKDRFYVLMNTYSASATGGLLGLLKSYSNATFIGEESGANPVTMVAGDILTLVLPNSQIEVKVPLVKSEANVSFENTGRGLLADIPMKPTFKSLLTQEDEILEKTLKLILNQK